MATTNTKIHRITNMDVSDTLDNSDPNRYMALLTGEKHLIDLPLTGRVEKIYIEPAPHDTSVDQEV